MSKISSKAVNSSKYNAFGQLTNNLLSTNTIMQQTNFLKLILFSIVYFRTAGQYLLWLIDIVKI
jgi:hypothetical protein